VPDPGGLGLLTDLSGAWIVGLLDATVKGTILLVLAVLAVRLMDGAPAAARHLVWASALLGLLALPALAPVTPGVEVSFLPRVELPSPTWEGPSTAVGVEPPGSVQRPGSGEPAVGPPHADGAIPAAGLPPEGAGSPGLEPTASTGSGGAAARGSYGRGGVDPVLLLFGVWLLGALLVLANLLVGKARIRWLARDAERVRDGPWEDLRERVAERLDLEREVVLLRGVRPLVPMTWGIVRPRVLLPETADAWPDACRENVLLHELAHVKRRDCLVQLLVRLACAVYWFHPLVWHAVRRLRLEQEEACDDHVLRAGTRASDYARQLVGLARLLKAVRTPAHAGSTGIGRTDFVRRMRALLAGERSRRELGRRGAATLASAVAVLVLGLAVIRPGAPGPAPAADEAPADRAAAGPGEERAAALDVESERAAELDVEAERSPSPSVEAGPPPVLELAGVEVIPPFGELHAGSARSAWSAQAPPPGAERAERVASAGGEPTTGAGDGEIGDGEVGAARGAMAAGEGRERPAAGPTERDGSTTARDGELGLQAAFAPYWHTIDGDRGTDASGDAASTASEDLASTGEAFRPVTASARALARELDGLEDPSAREARLRRDARQGSTRTLAVLMEVSFLAERGADRVAAVRTLAGAPSGARARFLYQVARANPWAEVRAAAVEQLRRLEPERVVPWLVTLAYRDASPAVQRRVVAELARLNRDGVDVSLMQIARSHPERKVRLEAIIWLLKTGSGQALSKYVENA
jgi:beta-lactamase regulating signal transducer with metallopeptidase domain